MEIQIKPKTFTGANQWHSKCYGVVLVKDEKDIDPLWKLLCEQDNYWEHYKSLIKVAPTELTDEKNLTHMCSWVGKTDIYDVEKIKSEIDFAIFQFQENQYSNITYYQ